VLSDYLELVDWTGRAVRDSKRGAIAEHIQLDRALLRFQLAIWGLSPPTSLTAAVAAEIADASFIKTMWEALKICLPITIMSFAIFVRTDMVVNPGWDQIKDTILVAIGACGFIYAMFGRLFTTQFPRYGMRLIYSALALVVVLYPQDNVA